MADDETVNVDGRPISSLRVVDLKKECEKRSLSKSGSKSQLVERLKTVGFPLMRDENSRYGCLGLIVFPREIIRFIWLKYKSNSFLQPCLSICIYCVTHIIWILCAGLPEMEESQDISLHPWDMPEKLPRPVGDSQITYIPFDFFSRYYFFPGWTRTSAEEVCSSVVKYIASADWDIPVPQAQLSVYFFLCHTFVFGFIGPFPDHTCMRFKAASSLSQSWWVIVLFWHLSI